MINRELFKENTYPYIDVSKIKLDWYISNAGRFFIPMGFSEEFVSVVSEVSVLLSNNDIYPDDIYSLQNKIRANINVFQNLSTDEILRAKEELSLKSFRLGKLDLNTLLESLEVHFGLDKEFLELIKIYYEKGEIFSPELNQAIHELLGALRKKVHKFWEDIFTTLLFSKHEQKIKKSVKDILDSKN